MRWKYKSVSPKRRRPKSLQTIEQHVRHAVVRPVFVEVQATHVSKRFHPPIDDQRHQGVFFVSDPGSDAKRIDGKDADEFDDLVMVAAVARQPIVFELSAAYSTERKLDEVIYLIVREIIRRLREDWLIFREQYVLMPALGCSE